MVNSFTEAVVEVAELVFVVLDELVFVEFVVLVFVVCTVVWFAPQLAPSNARLKNAVAKSVRFIVFIE